MLESGVWLFRLNVFCSFVLICLFFTQIPYSQLWQWTKTVKSHYGNLNPASYGTHFVCPGEVRSKQQLWECTSLPGINMQSSMEQSVASTVWSKLSQVVRTASPKHGWLQLVTSRGCKALCGIDFVQGCPAANKMGQGSQLTVQNCGRKEFNKRWEFDGSWGFSCMLALLPCLLAVAQVSNASFQFSGAEGTFW